MNHIATNILNGSIRKIVILFGAGVSVPSGIPDFRSKGGLYDTLRPELLTATDNQKILLQNNPTAVVDINLFQYNQFPYLEVRRPFILGTYERKWKPTIAHYFCKILDEKKLLQRLYTQNIDGLDYHTGINHSKVISVHGSIEKVECEFCKTVYDQKEFQVEVKYKIRNIYDITDLEAPVESTNIICKKCNKSGVKPATVLYGTNLPTEFFQSTKEDFPEQVDLLIIAGSSLTVQPACSLVQHVKNDCPRILVNRELVGTELGIGNPSRNDVVLLAEADDGFIILAAKLGWLSDLYRYRNDMCEASRIKITKAYEDSINNNASSSL